MQRKRQSAKPSETPLAPFVPHKEFREIPGQFAANMLWLQTNWANYTDRWVALNNGKLLVSSASEADLKPYLANHPNKYNIMCLLVGRDYKGVDT